MQNFKNLLVISLLLITIACKINAQGISSGKMEYQVVLNLDKASALEPQQYKILLYFFENKAISIDKKNSLSTESDDDLAIFVDLSVNNQIAVFKDYSSSQMISSGMVLDKLFRIKDTIPSKIWKLHADQKQIKDLNCSKATGKFRGRHYTAWYAPGIPVNFAPWKFGGLPGLVVSIKDEEHEVTFELFDFKPGLSKKEKEFIHPPTKGKIIGFQEYFDLWNKKAVELENFFRSELSTGEINVQPAKVFRIEKQK